MTCCFEGTAFLVIFLWPSVLQGAHEAESADADSVEIPYGVIFGSFMAAMIIGALFFSVSSRSMKTPAAPVWLLLSAISLACLSLLLLAVLAVEVPLYYAFLGFEVANGIYVPSMAYMRGLVVDSKSRAGIYGLMKIPLFIFVILALGITAEGESSTSTRESKLTKEQAKAFGASSSLPHRCLCFVRPLHCWSNFEGLSVVQANLASPSREEMNGKMPLMAMASL